ncbi:MAG: hypothetical protein VB082_04000 [Christensenella sp.]|nr:hypothetical protein [Christensenella sp.]
MEKETKIKKDCSAFCPKCGADLYSLHGVCYCKNKDCDYTCDKCAKQRESLAFGEE